jgi:hypothetical protein
LMRMATSLLLLLLLRWEVYRRNRLLMLSVMLLLLLVMVLLNSVVLLLLRVLLRLRRAARAAARVYSGEYFVDQRVVLAARAGVHGRLNSRNGDVHLLRLCANHLLLLLYVLRLRVNIMMARAGYRGGLYRVDRLMVHDMLVLLLSLLLLTALLLRRRSVLVILVLLLLRHGRILLVLHDHRLRPVTSVDHAMVRICVIHRVCVL